MAAFNLLVPPQKRDMLYLPVDTAWSPKKATGYAITARREANVRNAVRKPAIARILLKIPLYGTESIPYYHVGPHYGYR